MSLYVSLTAIRPVEVYSRNITHNLNQMADKAGLYQALWRPEELNISLAKDLIPILEKGLNNLRNDPDKYRKFDPPNNWGNYEGLVDFVEDYLTACKENPDAEVSVSR